MIDPRWVECVSPSTEAIAVTQHYVRDDTGGLVGIRETGTDAKRGYYLFDGLGSVAAITNAATGAVANRYTYDPYGVTSEQRLSGAMDNPWRYTGELQDTATGLYKIGARYLDTTLGRWTQQDPLLRAVNPVQTAEANPYAYVGCNPVNFTDPSGASVECVISVLTTLGGLVAIGTLALSVYLTAGASIPVVLGNLVSLGFVTAAGYYGVLNYCF